MPLMTPRVRDAVAQLAFACKMDGLQLERTFGTKDVTQSDARWREVALDWPLTLRVSP